MDAPDPTANADAKVHADPPEAGSKGPLRRLYRWVLSWAESPHGERALFWLALAEASFFPIPPDLLLIPLGVGKPKKALRFAAICLAGSVLGGALGYGIGFALWEPVGAPLVELYQGADAMKQIEGLYAEYGFWGILAAAITPIPYKVFTIASGFLRYPFLPFMLASVLGRGCRFFAVGLVVYFFGPKVQDLLDRYLGLISILFFLLLVGGVLLVKVIL